MDTQVISVQNHKAVTVVQLSTSFRDSFNYISGARAIRENLIEVTEVNKSGEVNFLKVVNLSKDYVFFMDGDILAGAKQNRVLNTSVLLSPNSNTKLPVSCVEQGRWSAKSEKFSDTSYSAPTSLRAKKAQDVKENLKYERMPTSDQGAVWSSVNEMQDLTCLRSSTSNLSDIFDAFEDDFETFTKKFTVDNEANGLAIFTNNKLLNIDIFNRTDIFNEYFPKILKGAAIETYKLSPKEIPTEAEAKYKALDFLDKFETLSFELSDGVGVGKEKRFETESLTGFELVHNDYTIHLTALNIQGNSGKKRKFYE
jgi:hypothetical protein